MPSQKRPLVEVRRQTTSSAPTRPAPQRALTTAEQVAARTAAANVERAREAAAVQAPLSVPAQARVVPVAFTPARTAPAGSAPTHVGPVAPAASGGRVAPAATATVIQRVVPAGAERPVVPPDRNVLPDFILRRPDRVIDHPTPGRTAPGGRPGGGPVVVGVIPPHWPIHLSASMLIVPGSSGQSPTLQPLRAPPGRWLVIDEIKFEVAMRITDNTDVATGSTNAQCVGSMIACSLELAGQKLTGGYVPVSMFGEARKKSAEKIVFNEDTSGSFSFLEEYSFKPKFPIVVAPGQVLSPSFEHRGYLNYKSRVRVSYSGHLENGVDPSMLKVLPYVMAWASPTVNLSGTEVESLSTEKDLVNPSNEDSLFVHHMLGRLYVPWQTAAIASIMEGCVYNPASGGAVNVPLATDQTKVKIANSWGNALLSKYTTFPAVFDPVSRKINMEHIVPPDGYFTVGVKTGGTAINNAKAFAIISVVGHREVA